MAKRILEPPHFLNSRDRKSREATARDQTWKVLSLLADMGPQGGMDIAACLAERQVREFMPEVQRRTAWSRAQGEHTRVRRGPRSPRSTSVY